MDSFRILLVGKTNVGKSTLFNRLSESREALVFDRPGVTRDLREKEVYIRGKRAILTDTPGMLDYSWDSAVEPELKNAINNNLIRGIKIADLVLFILDGSREVTPNDIEISRLLKKNGNDVVIVLNKSEKKKLKATVIDVMEFGFQDVVQVSAEHGLGIDALLDLVEKYIPHNESSKESCQKDLSTIKISITGRPNVGKSTLVNKIIKKEKQLTADFFGLTRESSAFDFEFMKRKLNIIDTPGIRRDSRIYDPLEKISLLNSQTSYKRADAVILMIDATSLKIGKIEKQDLSIAANIIKEGKPLVLAFNKCDKTPYGKDDIPEFLKRNLEKSLSQLKKVPFLFVSALNDENIMKMLKMVLSVHNKQNKKIKTSDLNNWLLGISKSDLLQSASSKFKLKYITQISNSPPSFLIFVSSKNKMRVDHERFISNDLRRCFDLKDIAIKVIFRDQAHEK
ncbi:MAG: ribosome biogenesis GTPase Der [Holosporales bacterium]|nr:ribosome biogenesis GTPase Der [Holosporales bacterium]